MCKQTTLFEPPLPQYQDSSPFADFVRLIAFAAAIFLVLSLLGFSMPAKAIPVGLTDLALNTSQTGNPNPLQSGYCAYLSVNIR
jgi:hypothetical protein